MVGHSHPITVAIFFLFWEQLQKTRCVWLHLYIQIKNHQVLMRLEDDTKHKFKSETFLAKERNTCLQVIEHNKLLKNSTASLFDCNRNVERQLLIFYFKPISGHFCSWVLWWRLLWTISSLIYLRRCIYVFSSTCVLFPYFVGHSNV